MAPGTHIGAGMPVTMVEMSAERNSTLIFPLPMGVLRLVDMLRPSDAAPSGAHARIATGSSGDRDEPFHG